jgi:type VI protein secretion system component Hcp
MATWILAGARRCAPILILAVWSMLGGATMAQTRIPEGKPDTSRFGGYMRMVSASGHVIAGVSTDPLYPGWIPLRQTTMPSDTQMEAMAAENSAGAGDAKAMHPPVVVVKDRDNSSLVLLGACTSRQHFPEVDITLTTNSDKAAWSYKLTDAVIVSVRAGGDDGGVSTPAELLRITYAKIEVVK